MNSMSETSGFGRENEAYRLIDAPKLTSLEQVLGQDDLFSSSLCLFNVAGGWDESVWVDHRPVTVIAWRLSGAAVTCHWGHHRDRILQASAISFQPKGTPNHFLANQPIRFAQLSLTDSLVDNVGESICAGRRASASLRADLGVLQDREMESLLANYLSSTLSGCGRLEIEAQAILITAHLLRRHHGFTRFEAVPKGGLAPWQLRRVCEAMRAELGRDFSLDQLAQIAGISATHFSRAFKRSTGLPPFAWLLKSRIEQAQNLLKDSKLSIATVGLSLGFSAQPQFTTAFKRVTGMTPGRWRHERLQ